MDIKICWIQSSIKLGDGHWQLFVDGQDLSALVPFKGTAGTRLEWGFYDDYGDWESHFTGKPMADWIQDNQYWLKKIAPVEFCKEIYTKFNKVDWAPEQFGGFV